LNASISVSNAVVEAAPEDAIVKWENKYYVFEDMGSYRHHYIYDPSFYFITTDMR